jgi:hypothetical protein|tara:strand:+ start:473 stop:679 length:207 start_codon:yes stop_codon:yes gene_type:complete
MEEQVTHLPHHPHKETAEELILTQLSIIKLEAAVAEQALLDKTQTHLPVQVEMVPQAQVQIFKHVYQA